jgi:hypothetical protein
MDFKVNPLLVKGLRPACLAGFPMSVVGRHLAPNQFAGNRFTMYEAIRLAGAG